MNLIFLDRYLVIMVIEWHERYHQYEDDIILMDANTVNAFRNYEILKFFKIPNMRSQKQLLIEYWDPIEDSFIIDEDILHLEINDIYFLTGLSRRGLETSLTGTTPRGALSITTYTQQYCESNTQEKYFSVPIKKKINLSLNVVLSTINCMVGSTVGHLATQPYMFLALSCLEPNIYNWCTTLQYSLCKLLKTCHNGKKKEFGYKSLVCSFFLEKIPSMQPRLLLDPTLSSEPWML